MDTKALMNARHASRSTIEFLVRVQSMAWNRKIFLTRSKTQGQKRLGLAPPDAREGDTVCILHGCSVPVVLRAITGDENYYVLIGECFLYGMMDGEALDSAHKSSRILEFELR